MSCFSFRRFLFATLLAVFSCAAFAQISSAPVLAAKSWILIDFTPGQMPGQTLAANEPDRRIDPAALTKLMTAYVAFSGLKAGTVTIDQLAPVSEKAWRQETPRMFIEPRIQVSVGDLIRGVIVHSGNDASVALAELLGGSEKGFVELMNREAERLGMQNTHFANSTGLTHPEQYSSVRDLATLASKILQDFPEYYEIFSIPSFTYNRIAQSNRNRLLTLDPTVDGLQAGYSSAAGYCLAASAQRKPRRLISIVTGAATDDARLQESLKLLNYGFQSYDMFRLYKAEQPLSQIPVWKGVDKQVGVGFIQDLFLSLPRSVKPGTVEAVLESQQPVMAPLTKGQTIGTLKLTIGGAPYGEYPVVALSDVPQSGYFGRLRDAVMLWLKSL